MVIIGCPIDSSASSDSPEQKFRKLYLHLLESGDNSVQDISDLELPYMTCYNIMEDVKRNEGFVPYQCYQEYNLIEVDKMEMRDDTPYLMQFHLSQNDSGFKQRYASVKQMIAEAQKNLDDKMTDLDKLLWFHEYVVEKIYYKDAGTTAEHLGGASLAQGYGVCEGYAKALALFLKSENIPCEIISGGSHEWLGVKIDNQWYHVDPTWDDTVAGSVGTHYFLMRNDNEFLNTLTRKHKQWVTNGTFVENTTKVSSTATDYMEWYVHKVWNRMYYYDGYWYYIMDNAVRKNNIQGNKESVVYEGKNLNIVGIENGVLIVNSAGEEKRFELKEVKPDKPQIQSISNKKGKKIKIVLKKKVAGAKGYEVTYSTNKKFNKPVKKITFTGKSKTISKLQKKKTYYLKVRAYKKNTSGKKIYSSYSSVRKIKITK